MWLGSLGFTLSYGAMFAKTWRVYVIFTNAKLRKRVSVLSQEPEEFLASNHLSAHVLS